MKTRMSPLRLVAAILLLSASVIAASPACAAGRRVLVMDFVDPPDEPGITGGSLLAAVRDEVLRFGAYDYVSPAEMALRWFAGEPDAESKKRFVVLSVLGHSPEGMGVIYEKQKTWPIELMLMCDIGRSGDRLRVRSMLVNIDNGRFCMQSSDCSVDDMKDKLRDQVKRLLAKASALKSVGADRETDALNSTVAYDLKTSAGERFSVEVKYGSSRMEPEIEDVSIVVKDCRQGEPKSLQLVTREKRQVELRGTCLNGRLAEVSAVTEPPAVPAEGSRQEMLSLLSEGGHVLNIVLHWKDAGLKAMRISPASDPYGEVES